MLAHPTAQIENWPIERLVEYPRNQARTIRPWDRMCASIRKFGFKTPASFEATARWWTDTGSKLRANRASRSANARRSSTAAAKRMARDHDSLGKAP
jgi:hypothetical protein